MLFLYILLLYAVQISKVKLEFPDEEQVEVLSPETAKLVKGLGDSPESVQLKAEILRAANELKRGHVFVMTSKHIYIYIYIGVKLLLACRILKWICWRKPIPQNNTAG